MKKILLSFAVLALIFSIKVNAQEQKTPDWKRWHYLSEEEMHTPVRNENFVETDPPAGTPRFVAEFEPMQGVMIRYPLGIPTSLVVDLANNCHVYCVTQQQGSAQSAFQNAGVNMNNVTFVNAATDSYWIRDYGPWYIFEDRTPAIVDNRYNRPRPNDDEIPGVFANFWNIPMYGMNLEHTGGNMMEDGRGHGVSDELVFNENNNNETNVRNKMRDYLGIDPYHVTIDPQGDYIAHVDCWGKYLAPDKILIAQLPANNEHYADYEEVANYFATTNCCWGYPYHVYRVQEPGGYTLAPYTNSLILNKSVYVPLGDNANYNQMALDVYAQAMPGYEIVGVYNNTYNGWENTDALHCRTRGVMDFDMLFVDHRDVLHDTEDWQATYPVVSKFIAYSGEALKQDSLLVYYSINGGEYQVSHMTATGEPDEYVGYITGFESGDEVDYYVFGADESNHRYTQPVFAELDPHHFIVGGYNPSGQLVITPESLRIEDANQEVSFFIINEKNEDVVIESFGADYSFGNNKYLEINCDALLPYTLTPGSSLEVTVGLGTIPILPKGYVEAEINITTSAGIRTVMVEILDTAIDSGLYTGETVYYMDEPYMTVGVRNGNTGSNTPIEITSITENNTTGSNYLIIEPSHELPYSLSAGEDLLINLGINTIVKDEPVYTEVTVHSEQNTVTLGIIINESLLNVTEISSETNLYPNPMNDVLHIEGVDVQDVTIFNAVGQQVLFVENTNEINVADLSEGLYFVRISDKNGNSVVKKIVKS
jgi:agmatine/peptidylarginine deiminase